MNNTTVRIKDIQISNIKNTKNGHLEFSNSDVERQSEIIGLYGQNGSGKTAVILALYILKAAMSGDQLSKDVYYYILNEAEKSHFKFTFVLETDMNEIEVIYEFDVCKNEDSTTAFIDNEKIVYKKSGDKSFASLAEVGNNDVELLMPKYKFSKLNKANNPDHVNLVVSKKMSIEKSESFIFRRETLKIFKEHLVEKIELHILYALNFYANFNMFVVLNNDQSHISGDNFLPLFFKVSENLTKGTNVSTGIISVKYGMNELGEKEYILYKNIIQQISSIIYEIIPGMTLHTKAYGETTLKDGNLGYRFELMSQREGFKSIPIKYESDGIKKILSVLSALIAMFNSRSVLVAIDELDSGIFEYLLGELLEEINDSGKGQLIFTSHNLRPLEVLHYSSVYFTTVNPDNRYIRFVNVKPTNNLRNLYYREIALQATGQKEAIYKDVKMYKVGRAFRKAGKLYGSIKL